MDISALKPLADSDVERLLRDWRALNNEVTGLPLSTVHYLLLEAFKRNARWQVTRRIYGRFNRLRMIEELKNLKSRMECP